VSEGSEEIQALLLHVVAPLGNGIRDVATHPHFAGSSSNRADRGIAELNRGLDL
jgi:hypothetical protein